MRDFERANRRAIDLLNQRGGRMLSLVDLLDAGTVSMAMAAEMTQVAAEGGSFLTAAGPGGVGKTTLMGAMLAVLPPGTEIVTIEGPETIDRATRAEHPQCLVVHEIGAGSYYGYLWGRAVGRYFEIGTGPGRRLASNLHAETYEEVVAQLTGLPLGVAREALGRVSLLAFMAAERGRRRVTAVWRADGRGGHRPAWQWRPDDTFERTGPADPGAGRYEDFLARAQADGVRRIEDLRDRALAELFV